MKGFLAFGALLGVILLGLGLWSATPRGGGGLGDEGGAGLDRQDVEDGVAQDNSEGRIEIRDGKFSPATVELPARSVVTFINRDDATRRIDFEGDRFEDVEIEGGRSHTFEVEEAGRISFTGDAEGDPTGEIIVR